jgi:hypothetical protein
MSDCRALSLCISCSVFSASGTGTDLGLEMDRLQNLVRAKDTGTTMHCFDAGILGTCAGDRSVRMSRSRVCTTYAYVITGKYEWYFESPQDWFSGDKSLAYNGTLQVK